ncbi:MAG: BPL-N domain-containing protein [Acidibacillus sp.]|nr:BPL-N domain-containing protein [Acidibacillus sp.]
MKLISLGRKGMVNIQPSISQTFTWVNTLLRRGVDIYQIVIPTMWLLTAAFPEGHLFSAGTLLVDSCEDAPENVLIDELCEMGTLKGISKLQLPRKLYLYNGLNSVPFCFDPYQKLLIEYGFDYLEISDHDIRNGILESTDVLIVPGGPDAGESYYAGLGERGFDNMRAFIARGGGYIGSCAGSYLPLTATRSNTPDKHMWLNVIPATDRSGLNYWRTGAGFVRVALADDNFIPFFSLQCGQSTTMDVIYWEGPIFELEEGSTIRVLAVFDEFIASGTAMQQWSPERNLCATDSLKWNNPLTQERFERYMKQQPAIVEARYGDGRLILYSFHPEFGFPQAPWQDNPLHLSVIHAIYALSSGITR